MERNDIQVSAVGDGNVGKTCLLKMYMYDKFSGKYIPTYQDAHVFDVEQNGNVHKVGEFDIGGAEDYPRLRPLCYPQTDVFILCYCVERKESLENITDLWLPELHHHAPNVPIILVANKIDLRSSQDDCSDFAEGYKVAKENNLYYAETTSLRRRGLKQLFELVIDIKTREDSNGSVNRHFKKPVQPQQIPPPLPLADITPGVQVQESMYPDHMSSLLQDSHTADVVFVVEGVKEVKCQKVILCSACNYFCQVFGVTTLVEQDEADIPFKFTWADINEGKIAGLSSITEVEEEDGRHVTRITISKDISYDVFLLLLDFLYTGLPKLEQGVCIDAFILNELRRVSKIFFVPYLMQIVANRENDEEDLNQSIGSYINVMMGKRAKALFLGKDTFSDVTFTVQESIIPAHKAFLMSRCDVMARMFGGSFTESTKAEATLHDEDLENFQALLEYLYTDFAPVEEGNHTGILVTADRYGQERLKNFCEFYLSKEIENSVKDGIVSDDVNVCEVLHAAQVYNAKQLANWCLHLISINYATFSERSEFKQLEGDNLDYVAKNRWPPEWYLEELKEYEALVALDENENGEKRHKTRTKKKCEVM